MGQLQLTEDMILDRNVWRTQIRVEGWTLLVREVLILLNRLVSHPKYSSHALRALTNSREKATLTVDVTSRLSSKHTFFWQDVSMTRQIRESEIIDLAQVLTRRVFTFLGGSSQ
ncbi:hypothetical protein FXO37_21104 [Capsicum annuum]|nr:hypothetical protein FXO37_21104 [Capsicum annuum]